MLYDLRPAIQKQSAWTLASVPTFIMLNAILSRSQLFIKTRGPLIESCFFRVQKLFVLKRKYMSHFDLQASAWNLVSVTVVLHSKGSYWKISLSACCLCETIWTSIINAKMYNCWPSFTSEFYVFHTSSTMVLRVLRWEFLTSSTSLVKMFQQQYC